MDIKIGGGTYPLLVCYPMVADAEWQHRQSYFLKIGIDHETAAALFVDGALWSTMLSGQPESEIDRSDYCVAGRIIDYRDGTVGVYMGRKTEVELLAEQLADARAALALLGVTDEQEEETDDIS